MAAANSMPPRLRLGLELHPGDVLVCSGDTASVKDYLLKPYGFVWQSSGGWRRPGPGGREAAESIRATVERDGQAVLTFNDLDPPIARGSIAAEVAELVNDLNGGRGNHSVMAGLSRTPGLSGTAGWRSPSNYFDDLDDATCLAAFDSATASMAAACSPPGQQPAGRQHMSGGAAPPRTEAVLCDGHREKCARRQWEEKGNNHLRWYFCCAEQPRCNTFKWEDQLVRSAPALQAPSDLAAPLCTVHGLPCVIFQVKKQGPNHGRWFFRCTTTPQCKTFVWADASGGPSSWTPPCTQVLRTGPSAACPRAHPGSYHTQAGPRCAPLHASPGAGGAPAAPTKRQLFTDDDLSDDFLAQVQRAENVAAKRLVRGAGDGPAG